ncbi:RNA polymerase sigma factor SigW [Halobacillus yeomjeoni]|uniref:RNA polymerase sigma factor n=1 Tax=Halobacillus yeomjeoni TaxID=311194 RepID=A0A931MW28_9BACI|nr:RNA polymerase sigma factor SigW [Halobacillus yeomjeoni]MBH0231733.1 RNA polymerase sigma factor SigW [Halobacillus yeomjeoni]MCA0984944.1 RNA polymerase sigma factor SigW [Halobacillus yeomjeoni]
METMIKQKIKEVKKGDQSAFEDIVSFYQNKVYHICFRMIGNAYEAEDLAQEAFIRAYTNIHTFDNRRKFSTWLYRIATNLTIDRIRKKKPDYHLDAQVRGTEGLDMYSQLAADQALPEEEVESLELQTYIHKEILALPPKYRSVIVLRYLDELPLQDIAEILDIPVGTVKTRVHRGREALRKKLRHV